MRGGKTPREILETTPTKDFAYYHALYEMEPWGIKADAFLASIIVNMSGKTAKDPMTPSQILKKYYG